MLGNPSEPRHQLVSRPPDRSAVIQRAVELLRMSELGASYAQAWADWAAGGDAEAWEPTVGDGLAESA